jgi:CHAT domain-containing protein
LSQNQSATFSDAMQICYKLYKQTKQQQYIERAFELSERSKSSNLLASVKDLKAKEFGGIPDSLLVKESIFKSNIDNYTQMLFEESHNQTPDSQKINTYNAKIFKFTEAYNKLVDSFEKLYPRYYSFKYENKVVGIDEVQSRLSKKQALIEYFINEPADTTGEGELYRFVITKDSVNFCVENFDHTFLDNIQQVRDFLVSPNYLYTKKKDFVTYSLSSYRLYEKLLAPAVSKIYGKDLTVIPHDKLSYIPFDALLSELPDTTVMNFRNLKYLVRDYAINYSYSATLLYDFSEKKKSSSRSLIAFSPAYNPEKPYLDPETSVQRFLSPLPAAREEVLGISRLIKTSSFLDDQAQEKTFKEKASGFDILHLAMHTIINDSLPMFSKLVFSESENDSLEDGFLNTYEVYNMKLNARLAVLSACETGSGKLQKGEGVMSMARSFIYAGCPSIVMTLWQVEDKSGAQIMEDFYYFISKGKRKDVALRMAKLKHLEASDPLTSHPHYWLAYVNIGNPEPLKTSPDRYLLIFLVVVGLLLAGDWYRRKHRN